MSLQLAGVLEFPSDDRTADSPWWLSASDLRAAVEPGQPALPGSAWYRFGDAVLEIASNDPELLQRFGDLYGECEVSPPFAGSEPSVRCSVRRGAGAGPIVLTFLQGAPPDPAAGALSLFQPTGVKPPYSVYDSPIPGWKLAGSATRPVVAVSGAQVLIDSQLTRLDFLVEYLVSATLASQPALLVAHAGSVRIGDAAVLLSGPTHSGKTTLSLQLAARGHGIYTDDAAVIRLATNEVVALRQAARLRTGVRTRRIASALASLESSRRQTLPRDADGSIMVHVGELFPGALPRPAKLRAAFVLSGFGDRPSLAPLNLTLREVADFDCLASMDIAFKWWGLPHGHRAMRLLALRQILARLPGWLLTVGEPEETAELIEQTMEKLC